MPATQLSFDDLGIPLSDVTWCVVDLETTGGSAAKGARITEVGAVKVRGGEVLGEFQTLVNPETEIPAFITVLTGITGTMVQDAPTIDSVLPSFLEFASGSVLVAHNAPFDVGFLTHAARGLQIPWPGFQVVDTATLARKVLLREEVPNVKLATLAARFSSVTPDHRALTDARATVDVLHVLFERLGSMGVTTLEDITTFTSRITPQQRKKRYLADAVPPAPGVYLFRDRNDEVLYVGTSRNLRARVRSYFTKAETRSRMSQMITLSERIETVVCATAIEAAVRELRLIDGHRPAFNRRSKFPEKVNWLKLTREPWPRLSIVKKILDDDADHIGPFGSRRAAESALLTLHEAHPIRQCTGRLPVTPRGSACMLAELDRCLSPCDGSVTPEVYHVVVDHVRHTLTEDPSFLVDDLHRRMSELAAQERYEEAAAVRERTYTLLRAIHRTQRLSAITSEPEIIATERVADGWDVHVIRYGRLAAAGHLPANTDADAWLSRLVSMAETVTPGPGPAPAALVEETEVLARWLESDGVRLIRGRWVWPRHMAARHLERFTWDRQMASLGT